MSKDPTDIFDLKTSFYSNLVQAGSKGMFRIRASDFDESAVSSHLQKLIENKISLDEEPLPGMFNQYRGRTDKISVYQFFAEHVYPELRLDDYQAALISEIANTADQVRSIILLQSNNLELSKSIFHDDQHLWALIKSINKNKNLVTQLKKDNLLKSYVAVHLAATQLHNDITTVFNKKQLRFIERLKSKRELPPDYIDPYFNLFATEYISSENPQNMKFKYEVGIFFRLLLNTEKLWKFDDLIFYRKSDIIRLFTANSYYFFEQAGSLSNTAKISPEQLSSYLNKFTSVSPKTLRYSQYRLFIKIEKDLKKLISNSRYSKLIPGRLQKLQ
jgi:hypothetical protein